MIWKDQPRLLLGFFFIYYKAQNEKKMLYSVVAPEESGQAVKQAALTLPIVLANLGHN